jgi:hypothetical protein
MPFVRVEEHLAARVGHRDRLVRLPHRFGQFRSIFPTHSEADLRLSCETHPAASVISLSPSIPALIVGLMDLFLFFPRATVSS